MESFKLLIFEEIQGKVYIVYDVHFDTCYLCLLPKNEYITITTTLKIVILLLPPTSVLLLWIATALRFL